MIEQLDQFMTYLFQQKLRPATVSLYCGAVRRALEAGDMLSVLSDEKLGASTLETYRKALAHWAAFSGNKGLVAKLRAWTPGKRPRRVNPARALDIEKEWPRLRRAVLGHEHPALAAVMYLLLTSGLRIAEVLDLTREDLFKAGAGQEVFIVQKGDSQRLFVLPTAMMRQQGLALAESVRLADVELVWQTLTTSRRGTRRAVEDYIRREMKAVGKSVGIPGVHPHIARHTIADAVYEQKGDARAVAEALGHKGTRTADRWYMDHTRKGKAAAVLGAAVGEDDEA
ncbi:MAG: site-specific integrase [Dehalococcoidia bacterium]|jgi:integrase|nr:site-specific integrase [Dehalococcoidia bacterium]